MKRETLDIYIVGVGGQGVLTIADLISATAFRLGIPVNYFPTKGMAQRGGFVKAEVRLGRENAGPDISEQGADLVVSMEISESLKAVKYVRAGGDFFVYGSRWEPAAVMLGKAPYPEAEALRQEVEKAGARFHFLDSARRPVYEGRPARENLFVTGALLGGTVLNEIFTEEEIVESIREKWPKGAAENLFTFSEGLKSAK